MRSICIDMGNTRAKAALFEGNQLLEAVHGLKLPDLLDWCHNHQAEQAIVASVGAPEATEAILAELQPLPTLMLNPSLPLPINIRYKTPQTLGVDRIAAAVAGAVRSKGRPVLVFDAGTCLTHEFVDAEANFWGGAISPGLRMRLQAMHQLTARLPLAKLPEQEPPVTGGSTEECLQSGAFWGMLCEISGTIDRYRKEHPDLEVILCGGDAKVFENKLKETIFVVPELVLFGLHEILRYNVSQK